jgi:hypothetical protein
MNKEFEQLARETYSYNTRYNNGPETNGPGSSQKDSADKIKHIFEYGKNKYLFKNGIISENRFF